MWGLPTSVTIGEREYPIRSDYRAVLDICTALSDPELSGEEKAIAAMYIFYPDFESMPSVDYEEAIRQCFKFINCGEEEQNGKRSPKLVDWEQDWQYIAAPVSRVAGQEIRSMEYMHWWTFVACYYEIGDCLFAQIVRIRDKLARGKPLDKEDRAWLREHRDMVDFKRKYTAEEDEIVAQWTGKPQKIEQ